MSRFVIRKNSERAYDTNLIVGKLAENIRKYIELERDLVDEEWTRLLNLNNKVIRIIGNNETWSFDHFNPDGSFGVRNSSGSSLRTISNGDSVVYDLD